MLVDLFMRMAPCVLFILTILHENMITFFASIVNTVSLARMTVVIRHFLFYGTDQCTFVVPTLVTALLPVRLTCVIKCLLIKKTDKKKRWGRGRKERRKKDKRGGVRINRKFFIFSLIYFLK